MYTLFREFSKQDLYTINFCKSFISILLCRSIFQNRECRTVFTLIDILHHNHYQAINHWNNPQSQIKIVTNILKSKAQGEQEVKTNENPRLLLSCRLFYFSIQNSKTTNCYIRWVSKIIVPLLIALGSVYSNNPVELLNIWVSKLFTIFRYSVKWKLNL